MSLTIESEPLSDLKDLLNDYWEETKDFPKPQLLITNDPENAVSRLNLQDGDAIVISQGPEQIRYRGNISYFDRVNQININIYTMEDRQKLNNLYKMVRAICFDRKHNFPSWQLIRLLSFQEMVEENLNIWRAQLSLQLENHGVAVDTLA